MYRWKDIGKDSGKGDVSETKCYRSELEGLKSACKAFPLAEFAKEGREQLAWSGSNMFTIIMHHKF